MKGVVKEIVKQIVKDVVKGRVKKEIKKGVQEVVKHPTLGDITVSQTARLRRISLSVRPPNKIRLSVPRHVSLSEAMRFVDSKEEWVRRSIAKYAEHHSTEPLSMPYSTRHHALMLNPCGTEKAKIRIADGRINVDYPLESNYLDADIQEVVKRAIEEAWRIEAKQMLPLRVQHLADQLGFRYRSVTVRNTVSKWGSCSSRDDISLSLHLMRMPDHLIDYIIVHELCHTVHKNHSPKFHALLDRATNGSHKELNREIKKYHTRW